jgi:hypothetical protein
VYSNADADRRVLGTPDPYLSGKYHLIFFEVGCTTRICENPARVYGVLDMGRMDLAWKTIDEWQFDERINCGCGRRVGMYAGKTYPFYPTRMPF